MTFQKSYLKSAISHSRIKPKTPQIIIKNPLKTNLYVNAINLVADIYFSLKGKCEIRINNNPEFTPDENAFKLRKELTIPLEGEILLQNGTIEIYIWNPTDDDIVELSAQIIISENKGNIVLAGQAIDDSTMLSGISGGAGDENDTHDIFEYKIYQNETREFLINTKGRGHMLLTMASSTVNPPQIIDDTFPVDSIPLPLEIQLILTFSQNYSGANSWYYRTWEIRCDNIPALPLKYTSQYLLIDYLNTDRKNITFTLLSTTPSVLEFTHTYISAQFTDGRTTKNIRYSTVKFEILNSIKHIVEASDDITFSSGVETLGEYDSLGVPVTKQYSDIYKRYVRIREEITCTFPSPNNQTLVPIIPNASLSFTPSAKSITPTEYFDELLHGGTAKLYFQLQGVNNQWFVILPSATLDAVTQGESKLIRYSIAGIPPSQSRFRAVLEVVGSLQTGVTIDLVG